MTLAQLEEHLLPTLGGGGFKSSHKQFYIEYLFSVNCWKEKTTLEKNMLEMTYLKNYTNCGEKWSCLFIKSCIKRNFIN